jgi:hypothetical protein
MQLIYTHENRLLVSNVQNILENANIFVTLKNEYAAGASGDLSFLNTWMEVWVVNDEDYDKAMEAIKPALNNEDISEWICADCNETNAASFDTCWSCQHENIF